MIRNIYILLLLSLSFGTVTDIDGNVYEVVQIGEQLWMKENLKVTHYRNGDEISNVDSDCEGGCSGSYGNYDNNPENSIIYGRPYNWHSATDSRGLCMEGYHVATPNDWTRLFTHLGGRSEAGGKLKQTSYNHWNSPNTGASNSSQFKALGGGQIEHSNQSFVLLHQNAMYWTDYAYAAEEAHMEQLYYNSTQSASYFRNKLNGYSIRCIQD